MREKVKKFLSMLIVEIDDLEDSFRTLMNTSDERFKQHDITGYVWTENRALLQREINLLEMTKKEVHRLDPEHLHNMEEARSTVLTTLNGFADMPAAIPDLVEKRMNKILRYIQEG
jgi:hypothetical protein